MSIENNNQQEIQEIVKQKDQNTLQTIDTVLQEKFKDPIKESFFANILKDPQIKGIYTEESIKKFIQGDEKISKFYRQNQETIYNEKVKKIIEMIDIFEKNNGNITIININNTLEDDVDNKKDDVDNKKDDVDNKKDDVDNKKDDVDNKKDDVDNKKDDVDNKKDDVDNKKDDVDNIENNIELGNTLLESRKTTKESYDKLDKTKYPEPTAEEINKKKEQINEETRKKLDASKISTDEYAKFLVFEQKYEKDLKKNGDEEFLKNFGEFKEKIGEILPFSENNNPKTTDKLINSNDSLRTYASDSDALKDIEVPLSEEIKYDDEEFDTYVKFIQDDDIRKNIKKNQKEIQDFHQKKQENTEENPDDEAIKKIYQQYTAEIAKIKKNIKENTTDMLQKRILGSCISGLASYFDSTTIDKKTNFADDFDINTQEGYSIENDVLYIKGSINGNEIGFSYAMMEGKDTNLKADDHLHMNTTSNLFSLGVENGGQKQLGVKKTKILRHIGFYKKNTYSLIK